MNNISHSILALILALSVSLSLAQDEESQSYVEAVDALLKVKASTEVGVNLSRYTGLLVDAKVKVDKATPAHVNEKKSALINAMEAYTDAAAVWNAASSGRVSYRRGVGKAVMEKYAIPIDEGQTYAYYPGYITSRYLIRQLWDRANKSLAEATSYREGN